MKYKFNPKTGQMDAVQPMYKQIEKAVAPQRTSAPKWESVRTLRENIKLCFDGRHYHVAVCFKGQWRDIGVVTDINAIMSAARGPLVEFHTAWLRGIPIDNPTE